MQEKDYYLDEMMGIQAVNYGLVFPSRDSNPGGVTDGDGVTFIENTSLHIGKGGAYHYEESEVEIVDEEIVYLGMFYDCWGHCITDCLAHLWFVNDAELLERYKNLKWIYIGFERLENMNVNFRRCLEKLGIDESRLQYVSSVTKFRKIYIPDDCFTCDPKIGDRFYTSEYKSLIDRISSGIAPSNHSKVYFTRTAFKNKKDFGEAAIEDAFRNKGFEIIRPEQLSLDEQIAVLKGCDEFATTEGSVSHNAVFLKEGTKCDIVRKSERRNEYQDTINQMLALKTSYFDSYCRGMEYDKERPWNGPFLLRIDKSLANYLGCHTTFPFRTYLTLKTKRLFHRLGLSQVLNKLIK